MLTGGFKLKQGHISMLKKFQLYLHLNMEKVPKFEKKRITDKTDIF
jgi:hypothetical protein